MSGKSWAGRVKRAEVSDPMMREALLLSRGLEQKPCDSRAGSPSSAAEQSRIFRCGSCGGWRMPGGVHQCVTVTA